MKNAIYILLVFFLACSCRESKKSVKVEPKYFPEDNWAYASFEYSEKDKARLDSTTKSFDHKYSLLILKDGKIAYENYQIPYLRDSLIHTSSCTKSVVSMLFGVVFKKQLKENENQYSISYFPNYNIQDSAIRKIKNRHFLSMSSGMDWKGGIDAIDVELMSQSKDWAKYVFERKMLHHPDEKYLYNSGGTQVLSTILHKHTGNDLDKFARDSLFEPLGIVDYRWDKTLNGIPKAGWGLHLKMEDMARLGYLMLRKGIWKEKQIIPKYWVAKSTSSQIKAYGNWDYGYQFWVSKDLGQASYYFRGYYPPTHKIIVVIPALDLLAVYIGENSNFRNVINSHIKLIEEKVQKANKK